MPASPNIEICFAPLTASEYSTSTATVLSKLSDKLQQAAFLRPSEVMIFVRIGFTEI